jgi:hypothetical protein
LDVNYLRLDVSAAGKNQRVEIMRTSSVKPQNNENDQMLAPSFIQCIPVYQSVFMQIHERYSQVICDNHSFFEDLKEYVVVLTKATATTTVFR